MEGALDAPGWIGIGRWLSPDFWFSPFQGGNPVINALASLLYRFLPSADLPPSFFQTKCKNLAGVGRGIKAGSLVVDEKSMEGAGRSGMDRYRALVIPGFLVLSFSRRKSRDKRARSAPLPIPSLRWPAPLFSNEMEVTCGGRTGERLKAGALRGKTCRLGSLG
ncbi:hypothetical protein SAMN05720606_11265 [Paenibacillus polysaccharolyticus]|uniref:Uncharacterized protein n=1 Tax=Paenibacillus polysaccharolyticus TaxID=582692 RepID=A0A1G5JWE9_9BACL|nr:hypothetical protein SAMN05720606_11265 [Paenibacillus polysaccharolyticus]